LHRVFIDEFGNHDLKSSDDPNQRYLGLTGIIMRLEYEEGQFTDALNAIKQEIFGTTTLVLHRKEILTAEPPFGVLANPEIRSRFDELVLQMASGRTYRAFTVVIDKKEHQQKYRVWRFHPYHYCLTVLLERYVQFLDRMSLVGDVMVESRGKKENRQLEGAYRFIYDHGSYHVPSKMFQGRLTSRQLKIQPKTANVAGLQLADLVANPSCRSLICDKANVPMLAGFGTKIVEILQKRKYLRRYDGLIVGWGTKWLP
jgi:Protein of unknown function (DUF3800)